MAQVAQLATPACMAQVASSPAFNPGFVRIPPKSPLQRGEQVSCTCASANSQQELSDAGNQPPEVQEPRSAEVTQGLPAWLAGLFAAQLFQPCAHHAGLRKNECNFYCLACTPAARRGMCKYCLPDHAGCGGQVFQIRKYMYQTCVHVEDLQHLFDTSGVQAYCINSKRAVLIHPKAAAPTQQCPVFDNTCRGCDKPLRNDCTYCSLKCKADVQYGRVPCTPDVAALEPQPRAPMTRQPPPTAVPPLAPAPAPAAATDSEGGSAHSSASHWTASGRSKRRKLELPLRSHLG